MFVSRSAVVIALFFLFSVLAGCTSTRTIESTRTASPMQIDGSISDWPSESLNTRVVEEFDLAVTNDDEFVYISVVFKNNHTFRMARDFGFRIFLDSDKDFRRSFGIIYPAGITNVLNEIPGARKSYLENPGWRNIPENERMLESLRDEMPRRVMVIRRSSSSNPVRANFVAMEQLEANDIHMAYTGSERSMTVELKVPIRTGSGRDFAVDPDGDGRFYLGFEIQPPDYQDVTGERPEYDRADRGGVRDRRDRRQQGYQEPEVSNPQLFYMLQYNYQNWLRVRLDK